MWYYDDEENESSWKAYSFACRTGTPYRSFESIKEDIKEAQRLAVEEANREKKIFTLPTGGDQILWKWDHGVLTSSSLYETGWRERSDGMREEVYFYGRERRWMSMDERFGARQKYPRSAP